MAAILALLVAFSGLNSCDEGDDGCKASDFEGEFVGKYWLLNLIALTNNDTATVTYSGNTLTLTSALLNTSFTSEYDQNAERATVSNLEFDEFVIGGDTLFDITVANGVIELDAACGDLYISLSGVNVDSGTVTLPDFLHTADKPDGYPLENASMNTKNGLKRQ